MEEKRLHIICFDNPYPPTYGGAIDVFFRIKALSAAGIHITLHCFYKGVLHRSEELEELCTRVYYYPRKQTFSAHCTLTPYTVASRTDKNLLPRLLEDDAPILFEGLVSCALLSHPALRNRRKYFRECNVEHDYFHALGRASDTLWKKIFYHLEAFRLRRFERCLRDASEIWALAHQDEAYFRHRYPQTVVRYVPCFHGNSDVTATEGKGKPFILYHGNLSVEENEKAVSYIVRHIAPYVSLPIVIAGRNPSEKLKKKLSTQANIQLVESPSQAQMDQLLREAQIQLLITFQATGIKLKLLNALYHGKHVIVNPQMLTGTVFEPLCHTGATDKELISLCNQYAALPLTREETDRRKEILLTEKQLSQWITCL